MIIPWLFLELAGLPGPSRASFDHTNLAFLRLQRFSLTHHHLPNLTEKSVSQLSPQHGLAQLGSSRPWINVCQPRHGSGSLCELPWHRSQAAVPWDTLEDGRRPGADPAGQAQGYTPRVGRDWRMHGETSHCVLAALEPAAPARGTSGEREERFACSTSRDLPVLFPRTPSLNEPSLCPHLCCDLHFTLASGSFLVLPSALPTAA